MESNKCHLIYTFHQAQEAPKQYKGNLFLGSAGSIKRTYTKANQTGAVLTILNKASYQKLNIENSLKERNIHHLWIQLEDKEEASITPFLEMAHQFIKQHLQSTNVLVHCLMGKSRSASFVIAYLMRELTISLSQALNLVKSKRNFVEPNAGFLTQLHSFDKQLKQKKEQKKEQYENVDKEYIKQQYVKSEKGSYEQ